MQMEGHHKLKLKKIKKKFQKKIIIFIFLESSGRATGTVVNPESSIYYKEYFFIFYFYHLLIFVYSQKRCYVITGQHLLRDSY